MSYVASVNEIQNQKVKYLFGSEAYKLEQEPQKAVRHTVIKLNSKELNKLEKKEKTARVLTVVLSSIIVVFMCVAAVHMSTVVTTKQMEASSLSQTLTNKYAENNAIEYDIERSVNLAFIISEATRYGMVRAEHSQIHEFKSDNYEYIEKINDLP